MTAGILEGGLTGQWGERTSNLDWCEENYWVTEWMAEFWNTLSNGGMLGLGLYGCLCQAVRYQLEKRFVLAYATLAAVGLGSALFHGSLKYTFQLMDELPMLFSAGVMVYCTSGYYNSRAPPQPLGRLQTETMSRAKQIAIQIGILAYIFLVCAAYIATDNAAVHQIGYAGLVAVIVANLWLLPATHVPIPPALVHNARLSVGAFLLAFALWNVDNVFCDALRSIRNAMIVNLRRDFEGYDDKEASWAQWFLHWYALLLTTAASSVFQLHSWWHLLTGWCGYVAIQTISWHRLLALQGNASKRDGDVEVDVELQWIAFGLLPYLKVHRRKATSDSETLKEQQQGQGEEEEDDGSVLYLSSSKRRRNIVAPWNRREP